MSKICLDSVQLVDVWMHLCLLVYENHVLWEEIAGTWIVGLVQKIVKKLSRQ